MLIGFGHRARQGKDTAAMAILNSCPFDTDIRLYAFADALKMEVRVACGRFGGQYELIEHFKSSGVMDDWVHFEEPKPRTLLQWWGTWRRSQNPDYWIKRLRKTLEAHKPDVALVTDVRYPNEAEMIHELGGYVVKVVNTGATDVSVHEHESESLLDNFDGWDARIEASSAKECRDKAIALYERLKGQS